MTDHFAAGPLPLYALQDLVELTGAKPSQIQNWVVNGVFTPQVVSTGTGDFRAYTFEGLVCCALAVQLSRHRMPTPQIKNIVRNFLALTNLAPMPAMDLPFIPANPSFLKAWNQFINPKTRDRNMDPILLAAPDGYVSVSPYPDNLLLPKDATFVAVKIGAIVRDLERETGDSLVATSAVGTPPPRKRRRPK